MLHYCLQYGLWFAAPVVQLCLLVLMLRRGQRREYPIFFSYTIFEIVSVVALFLLRPWYQLYFYAYWVSGVIGVGIGFAVMYEIFQNVFRPYSSLRDLGNVLFKWSGLVLVLVAVVAAASGAQGPEYRIMQTILVMDRSVRVMQCGLVLFLFLFSNHLGLSSRAHVVGIALGFGIFAAVELTIVTLRAAYGPIANAELTLLKSGAYVVACCAWLSYLRAPEPARVCINQPARTMDWNLALDTLGRPQQESFLPMIESAVERVLQKREAELRG